MKRTIKILAASLVAAFAPFAAAQTDGDIDTQVRALDKSGASRGQAQVASRIAGNFTRLAGSEANALALSNALRTGEPARLTYPPTGTATTPTTSTIDPPTGHMGWGNVKISLALAQDQLARVGITNPTAEHLQAALNGGSVSVRNADGTTTTTALRGVLQMRADGMGWGNIAKAGGTKVGPVVSQLKMANTRVAAIRPTAAAGNAATPAAKTKGITTAAGSASPQKSKGITTAAGAGDASAGKHGSKGITTATGVANPHASRGLTTAEGATSATRGNSQGRGIVTGGGGGANVAAHGSGKHSGTGTGLVTGSGSSGTAVAQGNSGGNRGNGGGHNGKGKGG